MPDIELTDEERKAIASLKRVAKKWPNTLWLYANGDDLLVHRTKPDGRRADAHCGDDEDAFIVDEVSIPNDGGRSGP